MESPKQAAPVRPAAPSAPARPTPPVPPRPPRLSRQERRADTRERLLDAAAGVFNRLGYHGASLEAVAEAAGFTKGAVYSNFATKQDLFMALLDRVNEARVDSIEDTLQSMPLEQAIGLTADVLRRQAQQEGGFDLLSIEFWLAAMRDPEVRRRLAAGTRGAYERYGRVMEERLRHEGLHPAFTGAQLAQLINALGSGFLLQYYLDPEGTDLDVAVRGLRRMVGLPDTEREATAASDPAGGSDASARR